MAPPQTWYSRTLTDTTSRPALTGPVETDTVIIGGGLAELFAPIPLNWAGGHRPRRCSTIGACKPGTNGANADHFICR